MFICKLKQLRFNKGVSQKELSEQTSIRYPTISEMERGATKSCSLENLDKLCHFFNCTLNDIYEYIRVQAEETVKPIEIDDQGKVNPFIKYTQADKSQKNSATAMNDDIVHEQISTLIGAYKELDAISQAKLLVYADELKNRQSETKKQN